MCLVPAFFHHLDSNNGNCYYKYRILLLSLLLLLLLLFIIIIIIIILSGVLEMVSVATNDANIGSVINHIAWRIQNNGVREYTCTCTCTVAKCIIIILSSFNLIETQYSTD